MKLILTRSCAQSISVGQRIGPRTRDMPSWMAARSRMDEADPNTLMRTSEVMDSVQTQHVRLLLLVRRVGPLHTSLAPALRPFFQVS